MVTANRPWFRVHSTIPMLLFTAVGCVSPGERAKTIKENEALRRDNERLSRAVQQRDASVANLKRQIESLQRLGANRPVALFAPVRIEIASLSGGADYDDKPGDDGITVYVRPRDADGDAVKVPGTIRVQLLDNSNLGSPRVIGVYVFDDYQKNRKSWHGKLGTQHYSLKCPFPPGIELPATRKVLVSVAFMDVLSGATLTTDKEVDFRVSNP